jgi:hypothetical protein
MATAQDILTGSQGTANSPVIPGLSLGGGGLGTTGSITPAAWLFIKNATGADLQSLLATQQNASQGQAVDQISFLQQQLGPLLPQLVVAAMNAGMTEVTGGNLNSAQAAAVERAVQANPQMAQQLSNQYIEWLTDKTGSYGTLSGLTSKLLGVTQSYWPLGNALGTQTAGALGISSGSVAGGTTSGVTPEQSAARSAQVAAIQSYMAIYGSMPNQSQINELAGMNQASMQNWMDQQPYHGVTYGQFNDTQKRLNGAGWMTWFGHDPGDNDIKWAIGKSDQDITARIDDSNYTPIPGMKIGGYKAYSKAGDDLSMRLYGYSTPDHLINLMHQAGIKP